MLTIVADTVQRSENGWLAPIHVLNLKMSISL